MSLNSIPLGSPSFSLVSSFLLISIDLDKTTWHFIDMIRSSPFTAITPICEIVHRHNTSKSHSSTSCRSNWRKFRVKKIPNEKGGRDKLNWHTILYVVLLLISYLCTNYDVDKEGFRSARMDWGNFIIIIIIS